MMEEVGEDTNGESTFEFVGEKDMISAPLTTTTAGSTLPSISSPSNEIPLGLFSQPSNTIPPGLFSQSIQPQALSSFPTEHSEQPSIPFYDPTQHISPKETVLPPLTNPQQSPLGFSSSYASHEYPLQSEAFAGSTQQQPQGIYESNFNVPSQQSAFSLSMDNSSTMMTSQTEAENAGVWGWLKKKDFLNKVAEKAKSSVDTVITTLDPGMKEIINSGGDISVVVASGSEIKVSAVREAFQLVFGKATVQGISVQSSSIAPQPVGFSAGLKAAEERLINLKQQGFVHDQQVLLSIENFLVEFTPENWFDVGCLLLQDLRTGISLQLYTQATPVSNHYVNQAKDQTPPNYHLGWSGFAVTIGQILGPALGVHHSEWHQGLTGVSRREILFVAAKSIAWIYKAQLRR